MNVARIEAEAGAALLHWYDAHARQMPWRVGPAARATGQRPDPYRVWLSEVMLQQTTVAAVRGYFERFTALWPDVLALAAAPDAQVMGEWAGLGYYARARNLLKCARAVRDLHGGRFPADHDALLALPGIGRYTAASLGAIAFDLPLTVVDGNVERVMARLFAVEQPLPGAKPALTDRAAALTPKLRPGDHAQAVMDLGATICTPRRPACGICPLMDLCMARAEGRAAELPRKLAKKPKPVREGVIFVGRRADGAWLLEERPPSGLLGGMLGWPGSDWLPAGEGGADAPPSVPPVPPVAADWRMLDAGLRHTFTHFHLHLCVQIARLPQGSLPTRGRFLEPGAFRRSDLPTVMRKAHDLALPALDAIEPGFR
ncbi:A/G-specific adenine glycosylase [Profundibacterium mesophilum]|uniref:Adenine DNA glycosylase n=1 Tax=Profundibacterium mesophilum KAUST100406-0324 TaxID=1037889 RepID=A0A921NQE9_9RHOB|nr:A/G-specific adenine glycosylase [Profundibacterium mesophilum]KAF0675485.1 AG-specific adenine glycosylase [Profundibacterium mesophilum KAUST100406-0324]